MGHSKSHVVEGILWEGLSPFNNEPIVAIATDNTVNPKIGDMVQVWILPAKEQAHEARRTGGDAAVCGNCAQRPISGGGCYVMSMGISSVSNKYLRGGYSPVAPEAFTGRKVRWGAYGDPAMLPEELVRSVNAVASGWTGYTHQYKHAWAKWSKGLFMASADTQKAAGLLRKAGWGVFQTGATDGSDQGKATLCASKSTGEKCSTCLACNGRKEHIWIAAHGAKLRKTPAERIRLRLAVV
jgi:hypothetical protein